MGFEGTWMLCTYKPVPSAESQSISAYARLVVLAPGLAAEEVLEILTVSSMHAVSCQLLLWRLFGRASYMQQQSSARCGSAD